MPTLSRPVLTLPELCDRAAARSLHTELADAIGSEPLALDASKVQRIGQAMLQVLVSAARSDAGITIESPSEAFNTALALAGLNDALGAELVGEAK